MTRGKHAARCTEVWTMRSSFSRHDTTRFNSDICLFLLICVDCPVVTYNILIDNHLMQGSQFRLFGRHAELQGKSRDTADRPFFAGDRLVRAIARALEICYRLLSVRASHVEA
jgi:hypothetical protein